MSDNLNATTQTTNEKLGQLQRLVAKLQKARTNPTTPAWKKSLAAGCVSLAVLGAGYEGFKALHAGPTEIKPTMAALEAASPKPDETLKITLRIGSCYVTSSGLLLLNSMGNYRNADNVTIVVPAGHGFTNENRRQLIGKTFTGEVTKTSYNGKPQLSAVPGKFAIQ
jgi:hypothetical protein